MRPSTFFSTNCLFFSRCLALRGGIQFGSNARFGAFLLGLLLPTLLCMAGESNRAMRPFWLHQAVEYVIGAVFISSSVQSETPAVSAVLGVAVMINAALTIGPAGAFRLYGRKVHRIIDVAIIAAVIVATVQPVVELGENARVLMGLLAVVLSFVWWNTDFATKDERKERRRATKSARKKPARPTSEEVGQKAGRLVVDGINMAKRAKNNLSSDDQPSTD